ncbi:hypothetical protein JVU11DRAFT_106 [Chiua virens]|nr:hypothetical protein JVU11DRAFT_106 [Chiua virens]
MSDSVGIQVGPFYGALYFSSILSVGFYGVTCMQTFFYFVHYQEDPLRMKSFIAIIWVLDTIHQALVVSGVYKYLMAGLVNPLTILNVVPELVFELLLSTLVSVPTQAFFVYRIYIFSDKSLLAPIVWLPLGIYQIVATLIYVGKGANATQVATLGDPFFSALSVSYCAVAAAVDILIAFNLTFLLARRRIAVGFKNSARMLQLLTVFAINSGVWTALFALLTIVLLRAYPGNLVYSVFDFPLASIYCNTLLANMNARAYIKGQSTSVFASADLVTNSRGSGSSNSKHQANEIKFAGLSSSQGTDQSMSLSTIDGERRKVPAL